MRASAAELTLFERIASFPALREAALRAARGKRAKPGVASFRRPPVPPPMGRGVPSR